MKNTNLIGRLSDDEIRAAISYLEGNSDDKQFSANVAVVILIIGVVVSLLTLLLHVSMA